MKEFKLNSAHLKLGFFGYPENFFHTLQIAYTNIQSKIELSGLLSNPLTLMLGIQQGRLIALTMTSLRKWTNNDMVQIFI